MDNEKNNRPETAVNENFKVIGDLEEAVKEDESLSELVDFVNANLQQSKEADSENDSVVSNAIDEPSSDREETLSVEQASPADTVEGNADAVIQNLDSDAADEKRDDAEQAESSLEESVAAKGQEDGIENVDNDAAQGALTKTDSAQLNEIGQEGALVEKDKKRKLKKVKKEKSATNAFDRFFISLWAVLVSAITFVAVQINKIIKLIFKREAPLKYIKAFIATALIICLAFLITAPFRITQQSDVYPIYSNGLIPVKMEVGKDENGVAQYKWGYVDRYGNTKLEPIYDEARPFSNGGAWVRRREMIDDNGQKVTRDYWSVISLSGRTMSRKFITDATGLATVGDFDRETNLAWVREGSKYGYVRGHDGRLVVEIIYDDASDFSNNLARVKFGNSEYFINAAGKAKSESYEKVRSFANGFAAVCRSGGKWGFINTSCREIVECKFDEVWDFEGGYAKIRLGNNYGYINQNGKYEVPPNFGDLIPSLE